MGRDNDGKDLFPLTQTYLRYLGKALSSKKEGDSMEGGVKFVGSRFSEIGLDAQFTAELIILSRLKSSDSNSNSHSASNSISLLCSLVKFLIWLTSMFDCPYHGVVFLG